MGSDSGTAVFSTDLSLPGLRRGKVRDVYDLPPAPDGTPRLLVVASDRVSAFDVVMPTPLPGKGRILTQISLFWMRRIAELGICRTHLLSSDVDQIPAAAFKPGGSTPEQLAGRIMIVRKASVVPVECVVRGYLEGSGWREYKHTGSICGVSLPAGLRQCDRLPQPIFTPATKEEIGKHDENIDFERACSIAGRDVMTRLRELSLRIYSAAADYAAARGIILADTKFEFGFELPRVGTQGAPAPARSPESIMLIDEALTPDSSRFWPAQKYAPGVAQPSFDKQYLREYLDSLVAHAKWDRSPPGPQLPPDVVTNTMAKYREAMERLIS